MKIPSWSAGMVPGVGRRNLIPKLVPDSTELS